MALLWLLALSVPIFYIYGLYTFFRSLSSSDKSDEKNTADLAKLLADYPKSMSVEEILKKHQLVDEEQTKEQEKVIKESRSSEFAWSNWYNFNSINLLLYIGALLIISAASIFVGFQWQSISGIAKGSLITLLSLAFFGSGFWFFYLPKVKTAGVTFVGIGSLLMPLVGLAWYTFVLKDLGVERGLVWLITSLTCLFIYNATFVIF